MKSLTYKPLSVFADLINGYAFKSKNYVEKGIRVIRIANVQDGYISDESPCFYPANSKEDISKYILRENDFLISLTGNVGRVAILTADFLPAALNQRVSCIRIKKDNILPKFLFYYFLRKQFQKDCINASQGVAQLNLSTKWLEQYPIPVLGLDDQKRVVAKIEELFSELDNGVETLKKTKQQLAVYRQAVLKEAFDRAGTTCVPLNQLVEKPRYGTSKKCSYDINDFSVPVYRIPNINYSYGTIDHTDLKYATFIQDEIDSLRLCIGDILIIRSNGSISLVGRSAIVTGKDINGLFAGYLMRIRIKDKMTILPQYLNFFLNTHSARYQIEQMAKSTSGVNNINSDEICRIKIPVCSVDLQKDIIQEVERRLSVCDSIEKTVDTALQQAEAMRQSILKKAFEGEL